MFKILEKKVTNGNSWREKKKHIRCRYSMGAERDKEKEIFQIPLNIFSNELFNSITRINLWPCVDALNTHLIDSYQSISFTCLNDI